jgi:K+-sensing histidine kinase KdpD
LLARFWLGGNCRELGGLAADLRDVRASAVQTDRHGIGLSICRSIIEAHEERISATANMPRGVTLHITLPVSGKAAFH